MVHHRGVSKAVSTRCVEGTLVTIGYEGKTVGDLVATLIEQKVRILVDVRLTPLSRKPGLSKTKLSEALSAEVLITSIIARWATRRITAPVCVPAHRNP